VWEALKSPLLSPMFWKRYDSKRVRVGSANDTIGNAAGYQSGELVIFIASDFSGGE
jgi:hypothetical protein